jgi:hypothetical protein
VTPVDRRSARGLTLIEVVVVMALSTLVVMGMIGFYISSQSTWMAGSTQALAQRDATLLVQTITDNVRSSALAYVPVETDTVHQTLILNDTAGSETWRFWWNPGDSLVHQGPGLGVDRGPVVASRVTRFQLDTLDRLVRIRLIELRAGDGQLVRMTSAAALYNRGAPTP